jgi:hypothetical protein
VQKLSQALEVALDVVGAEGADGQVVIADHAASHAMICHCWV